MGDAVGPGGMQQQPGQAGVQIGPHADHGAAAQLETVDGVRRIRRLAMAHVHGWTDGEIRHAKEEKAQRRGSFRERVFLEKVVEQE